MRLHPDARRATSSARPSSEYTAPEPRAARACKRHDHRGRRTMWTTVFTASTHDYILFFTDTRQGATARRAIRFPRAGTHRARARTSSTSSRWSRARRCSAMIHCPRAGRRESVTSSWSRATARSSACRVAALQEHPQQRHPRAARWTRATSCINVHATDGEREHSARHPRRSWPSALPRRDVRPMGRDGRRRARHPAHATATMSSAPGSRSRARTC